MNEKEKVTNQNYQNYFEEDLKAIEEELEKSKGYSAIIDDEIEKLKGTSIGMVKGGQRYLIDHIKNAVELQTQRQSLRRDKFAIKKAILDYSKRDDRADNTDFSELLNKVIQMDRKEKNKEQEYSTLNNVDLDTEIDKLLDEGE